MGQTASNGLSGLTPESRSEVALGAAIVTLETGTAQDGGFGVRARLGDDTTHVTMGDLAAWLGADIELPEQCSPLAAIELRSFEAYLQSGGALDAAALTLGLSDFALGADFLHVTDAQLRLDLHRAIDDDPKSPLLWGADIILRLKIGTVGLDLHGTVLAPPPVPVPELDEDFSAALDAIAYEMGEDLVDDTFALHEDLQRLRDQGPAFLIEAQLDATEDRPIDLAALLADFDIALPFGFDIATLFFAYDGLARTAQFHLAAATDFAPFGDSAVTLTGIEVEIAGGEREALSARVEADFDIGEVLSVTVWAETSPAGWRFRGALEDIDTPALRAALSELGVELPATLDRLHIDLLQVEFDLSRHAFTLICEGEYKLESSTIDGRLTLALDRHGGSWTLDIGGSLAVALTDEADDDDDTPPLERHLLFDAQLHVGTESRLTASYDGSDAGAIDIGAVVSVFDPGLGGITGLPRLAVRRALLSVETPPMQDAPAAPTDCFAGDAGFEASLDLSSIHLPGLGGGDGPVSFPLVGPVDVAGLLGSVRIVVEILYAQHPQAGQEGDTAPGARLQEAGFRLPKDGLPDSTPVVLVSVEIGEDRHDLDLGLDLGHLGGDPQLPDPPGAAVTGTTPASPAPTAAASVGDVHWFNVHRTLGPLRIDRVGLSFDMASNRIDGHLEAALCAAGLTISLDGLRLAARFDDLLHPQFGLEGLGIGFACDPLSISGAFLTQTVTIPDGHGKTLDRPGFAGVANVTAEAFSLSAMGAYVELTSGDPSLMVYAVLDYPLGGPGFFFVTGLAAGFGLNRAVVKPDLDTIDQFPLIQQACQPAGSSPDADPMKALATLAPYLPPKPGAYFVALGVRFSSFKVIESFALGIATLDPDLEFELMGLSTIENPPQAADIAAPPPLIRARIAWQARYAPEQGEISLAAKILPGAFCFSPDAHLSGGFAFSAWLKPSVAPDGTPILPGDFVASLGGYHPHFDVPAHYPRPERLALNWIVNRKLQIKGEAYFALCAHAVMAGGRLDATWSDGDLGAHFVAYADLLICWEPYHYEAEIGIRIDAHATIYFFGAHEIHLHAEARLHIWGPEFGGRAEIHARVLGIAVDFDIAFANQSRRAPAIDFQRFQQAYALVDGFVLNVEDGLLRTVDFADAGIALDVPHDPREPLPTAVPVVSPHGLRLAVTSGFGATVLDRLDDKATRALGIAPMGIRTGHLSSPLHIEIRPCGAGDQTADLLDDDTIKASAITEALPASLWGDSRPIEAAGTRFVAPPRLNADRMVKDVAIGYRLATSDEPPDPVTAPAPAAATGARAHPAPDRPAMTDATPPLGTGGTSTTYHDWAKPEIAAGAYHIRVSQTLSEASMPAGVRNPVMPEPVTIARSLYFVVAGPRFALLPQDIVTVFPPSNGTMDYASALPHVVLSRKELPWLRHPHPDLTEAPWLAVILLDEDDMKTMPGFADAPAGQPRAVPLDNLCPEKVEDSTRASYPLWCGATPNPLDLAGVAGDDGASSKAHVSVLDIAPELLATLLPPTAADLSLLSHLRLTKGPDGKAEAAIVTGGRSPTPGKRCRAHLVSVEGLYNAAGQLDLPDTASRTTAPNPVLVRLVCLTSWAFSSCETGQHSFHETAGAVAANTGLLRMPAPDDQTDPATAHLGAALTNGMVPKPLIARDGMQTLCWYRGPLMPCRPEATATGETTSQDVPSCDDLKKQDKALGISDVTYAAARELGRLLAVADAPFCRALLAFQHAHLDGAHQRARGTDLSYLPRPLDRPTPAFPAGWFDGIATLRKIPFPYLVPDERLCPPESLRFFTVDGDWLQWVMRGAASVGPLMSPALQEAMGRHLPRRPPQANGFLLRSDLLTHWPGLHIEARDAAGAVLTPLQTIRPEPGLMLATYAAPVCRVDVGLPARIAHLDVPQTARGSVTALLHYLSGQGLKTGATVAQTLASQPAARSFDWQAT